MTGKEKYAFFIGSYAFIYECYVKGGLPINECILELRQRALRVLSSCVNMHNDNALDIFDFLADLKSADYVLIPVSTIPWPPPAAYNILMECNVLFSERSGDVRPQNWPMVFAIEELLKKVS